jgi:hypothetical protein
MISYPPYVHILARILYEDGGEWEWDLASQHSRDMSLIEAAEKVPEFERAGWIFMPTTLTPEMEVWAEISIESVVLSVETNEHSASLTKDAADRVYAAYVESRPK